MGNLRLHDLETKSLQFKFLLSTGPLPTIFNPGKNCCLTFITLERMLFFRFWRALVLSGPMGTEESIFLNLSLPKSGRVLTNRLMK